MESIGKTIKQIVKFDEHDLIMILLHDDTVLAIYDYANDGVKQIVESHISRWDADIRYRFGKATLDELVEYTENKEKEKVRQGLLNDKRMYQALKFRADRGEFDGI